MENKTAEEVYDEFAIPDRGNLSRYDVILLMNRHASQQCLEKQKEIDEWKYAHANVVEFKNKAIESQQAEIDRLKEDKSDLIDALGVMTHGATTAKIVCYCGSLRVAMDAFKKAEYEAVMKGEIALLPCCMFVDIQREYGAESDYKMKADDLHKRKIDICDEVFILNVGGYIGESTRSEIAYAESVGKPIKYLEALNANLTTK